MALPTCAVHCITQGSRFDHGWFLALTAAFLRACPPRTGSEYYPLEMAVKLHVRPGLSVSAICFPLFRKIMWTAEKNIQYTGLACMLVRLDKHDSVLLHLNALHCHL